MTQESNLIFGYGTMRSDIGEFLSEPPAGCQPVGWGFIPRQLWIAENYRGTWAGVLDAPTSDMTFGQLWAIDPTQRRMSTTMWALDKREGCIHNDPSRSFYHRRIVPVNVIGSGTAYAWTYVLNPDPDLNLLVEPVPSGDYWAWLDRRKSIASSPSRGRFV